MNQKPIFPHHELLYNRRDFLMRAGGGFRAFTRLDTPRRGGLDD